MDVKLHKSIADVSTAQTAYTESVDLKHSFGFAYRVSYTNTAPASDDFVDGDVTVAEDSVTLTAHGMLTGLKGQLTTTGTLPAGLATSTDYYIIKVDDDTVKFASSLANANAGTAVTISGAAGGGTHTFTPTALDAATQVEASVDNENWELVSSANSISATGSDFENVADVMYAYMRLRVTITAGQLDVSTRVFTKGMI